MLKLCFIYVFIRCFVNVFENGYYQFLEGHKGNIKDIIAALPGVFTSYDFIEKFARMYIDMFSDHKSSGWAFQTVHIAIARFLSENMDYFGVEKRERIRNEHVFGEKEHIQEWKKTNILGVEKVLFMCSV